jgi:hypothetical protein
MFFKFGIPEWQSAVYTNEAEKAPVNSPGGLGLGKTRLTLVLFYDIYKYYSIRVYLYRIFSVCYPLVRLNITSFGGGKRPPYTKCTKEC